VRKWTSFAIVSGLVVSAMLWDAPPASAHHSFTSFWFMDKTSTIEGVVVELRMVNPHPVLKVEVTDPGGQKVLWTITATATASALVKGGWTPETLSAGTKVKVEGHPPRRDGTKGLAAGAITNLGTGMVLSFGGTGGIAAG
jgi:hypothetical protein